MTLVASYEPMHHMNRRRRRRRGRGGGECCRVPDSIVFLDNLDLNVLMTPPMED
jgi:hypothetical protein